MPIRAAEHRTREPHRPDKRTAGMAVRIARRVDIPDWVRDHESFRRWARSPECPEHLRVAFYDGDLWVDLDTEQLYVHNQVKAEVSAVLMPMVKAEQRGRFIPEGMLLSNPEIGLSTIPDGYFVSYDALREGRVREVAGVSNGCVELVGTPEMTLEVVSDSSEEKDLVVLRELYYDAGVLEYWLIDARTEDVRFELLKRGAEGFTATRRQSGGWLKSDVFGRSFRLVRGTDPLGKPIYTLESR
jgi:Uma2 family endonuclease